MIFKNLLQSVGNRLTDYFIGDNPYELSDGRDIGLLPIENNKENTEKKNMDNAYCNKCSYCLRVLAPTNPPTWNIKCTHAIGDIIVPAGRIIKFRAERDDVVERPCWCPLTMGDINKPTVETQTDNSASQGNENSEDSTPKTELKRPKRWKGAVKPNSWDIETRLNKYKPRLSLDDIQEGDIIHVPPTPAEKRMDVLIKHKYVYSASGTVIGNENKTVYFYSSGLNSSIMSKRKKEDFEV
jgi:hypothetical protein